MSFSSTLITTRTYTKQIENNTENIETNKQQEIKHG